MLALAVGEAAGVLAATVAVIAWVKPAAGNGSSTGGGVVYPARTARRG